MWYLILLLLLLLFLMGAMLPRESFDVYYNHDVGAQKVYASEGKRMSVPAANQLARYDWSTRDKDGWTVYDKYYDRLLRPAPGFLAPDILLTKAIEDNTYLISPNTPSAYDFHDDEIYYLAQKYA